MDNQSKTITVSKVESQMFETGTQYKITTSENQKFKFYDKKKDGNPTVAFQQFNDMGIKVGSTVEVWYKELEKSYEGKPYTDRIIASFREAVKTVAKPAPVKQTYKPVKDTDWDGIAVGKCQTAFLAAYIQSGKTISDAKLQAVPARQLAELVVYGTQQADEETTPEEQASLDAIADNVPF